MNDLPGLRDTSLHMEWADALVWTAVLEVGEEDVDSRLRAWLYHLHFVQEAFRRVWTGEGVETFPGNPFERLLPMVRWAREVHDEHRHFLEEVEPDDLGDPLPVPWTDFMGERLGREIVTATLGETIFQVVGHSTYHRGQINRRIREVRGEPPLVDYVVWVWAGRPRASWPSDS
jgi:uncharacterized damage-inducible protein DinB